MKNFSHKIKIIPPIKIFLLWSVLCYGNGSIATATNAPKQSYNAWFKGFETLALKQGVTPETLANAMPFDAPIQRVITKDRKQIAFVSNYWHYQQGNIDDTAISYGQNMLQKHAPLFDAVSKIYGIPPQVFGALWAMETNYGRFTGKTNVIHALASLAYEGRRGDYFTRSLLSALFMIQDNTMDPKAFLGSYDGGYGHFQFMPMTAYGDVINQRRGYAIDGDRDGKIDILNSLPDALYSAGNYLAHMGWEPNQPWGHQVILPPDFDIKQTGYNTIRPLSHWHDLGVKKWQNNAPHPLTENALTMGMYTPATIVLPGGVGGPAFMMYNNARVIKKWNKSNLYSTAFATIATKLSGDSIRLPKQDTAGETRLNQQQIVFIQQVLRKQYIYKGPLDGWIGTQTQLSAKQHQLKHGLISDGYVGQNLYNHMVALYGKRPLENPTSLKPSELKFIQSVLKTHGMYGHAIDGLMGIGTKKAIIAYQTRNGLAVDGKPTPALWDYMQKYSAVAVPQQN